MSKSAIFYALKGLKISPQKTYIHPKLDRLARLNFLSKLLKYKRIDKRSLVYVDESGFFLNAGPDYGHSQ